MIHLRHAKGITNPSRPKAESLFLSDALDHEALPLAFSPDPDGECALSPGLTLQLEALPKIDVDADCGLAGAGPCPDTDRNAAVQGTRQSDGWAAARTEIDVHAGKSE